MHVSTLSTVEVIARTLRQLAEWGDYDLQPAALLELATVVEVEDYEESWCCPMCQEVECDTGCPLEEVRRGRLDT